VASLPLETILELDLAVNGVGGELALAISVAAIVEGDLGVDVQGTLLTAGAEKRCWRTE